MGKDSVVGNADPESSSGLISSHSALAYKAECAKVPSCVPEAEVD